MTLFSRMKRSSFHSPPAKEPWSRPKSYGGYWIVGDQSESDLPPLHPFQWCCLGLGIPSFLTLVVTILWQVIVAASAGSDSVPNGVLPVCLGSVVGLFLSLGSLLTFNRFFQKND